MKKKRKKAKEPVEIQVLKSLKGPCPLRAKSWDGKRKSKKQQNKEACRKGNYES